MKRKTLFVMLVCALAFVLGFASCAKDSNDSNGGGQSESIVGTWTFVSGASAPDMFVFLDSGAFTAFIEGTMTAFGTYTVSGNNVTLRVEDESGTFNGTISGNTLILRNSGNEVIYSRK